MEGARPTRETASGHAPDLPSLLWPAGYPSEARLRSRLSPQAAADLDLGPLVHALSGGQTQREGFVTGVLSELCTDPEVIVYRAQVVGNLLEDPPLCRSLRQILPRVSAAVRERERPMYGYQWTPGQIVDRLTDLELYVEAAELLADALERAAVRAPALGALRAALGALVRTEEFLSLRFELPVLREQLERMQSITIGVNLSRDLRPESAAILSIDAEKIEGRGGLLSRLFGDDAAQRGITRLRGEPGRSLRSLFPPMQPDAHGHENELVRDLRRLVEKTVAPIGDAIVKFGWARSRAFVALESELSFLLNGAALVERLRQAGLPVCRPEVAPAEDRVCHLEDAYNVSLALRLEQSAASGAGSAPLGIVTNAVRFDDESGRVWILTGPNRGGKTTYARAVGLLHLLFQAGLHVPARCGRLSPVDSIYTHFPRPESAALGEGRLDDEAIRLAAIFREATPRSLILINEGLSGTSTLESLALAHDAVRGFSLLGARVVFVTHLHELAVHVDEINALNGGGGAVGSLVSEVEPEGSAGETGHRRTFRIRPGPPLGLSYASEIAQQHGVSYQQLVDLLRARGISPGG